VFHMGVIRPGRLSARVRRTARSLRAITGSVGVGG
jgi:hypothetical protein